MPAADTLDADHGHAADHGQDGRGHDHGQPPGVSVAEAARILGVSVKTVRRRVGTGQLPARTVRSRFGAELRVVLDHGHDQGRNDRGHIDLGHDHGQHVQGRRDHGQTPGVDLSTLVTLVDKLTQQNLEMAGRLGYLQAQLAAKDETIKALEAPKEPIAPPPPAEPDPPRRPWWRVW